MPVDPLDFSRVQARMLCKRPWPHMCNQFERPISLSDRHYRNLANELLAFMLLWLGNMVSPHYASCFTTFMNSRKPSLACNTKPSIGIVKIEPSSKLGKTGANGTDDPFIPFSVQIRLSTYTALKQAECWVSGFGQMRNHVDNVLKDYFSQFPESQTPLPDEMRAKLKYLRD